MARVRTVGLNGIPIVILVVVGIAALTALDSAVARATCPPTAVVPVLGGALLRSRVASPRRGSAPTMAGATGPPWIGGRGAPAKHPPLTSMRQAPHGKGRKGWFGRGAEDQAARTEDLDETRVVSWLLSLGTGFDAYVPAFQGNAVDGSLLMNLTDGELEEEFGVGNKFHRKKIMNKRGEAGERVRELSDSGALPAQVQQADLARGDRLDHASFGRPLAPALWADLGRKGLMRVEEAGDVRVIGDNHDSALASLERATLHLGVSEKACRWLMTGLAHVPTADASAMEEVKRDLGKIARGLPMLKDAFRRLLAGGNGLVIALSSYRRAASDGQLSEDQEKAERELLKEELQKWKAGVKAVLDDVKSESSAPLADRVQQHICSLTAGGKAIADNVAEYPGLLQRQDEAVEAYKRAEEAAEPMVRLALTARSPGALTGAIQGKEQHIEELRRRRDSLERKREENERMVLEVEEIKMNMTQETNEIRDWHVKRFWRGGVWGWEGEMDTYERQANRSVGDLDRVRRHGKEQIQDLSNEIAETVKDVEHAESDLAEMRLVEGQWESILERSGLLLLEENMNAASEKVRNTRSVIEGAVRSTGIPDPEEAAEIITLQHRVSSLVSDASGKVEDAVQRLDAFTVDNWIQRLERGDGLLDSGDLRTIELVERSLIELGHGHDDRMRILDSPGDQDALYRDLMSTLGGTISFQSGGGTPFQTEGGALLAGNSTGSS